MLVAATVAAMASRTVSHLMLISFVITDVRFDCGTAFGSPGDIGRTVCSGGSVQQHMRTWEAKVALERHI